MNETQQPWHDAELLESLYWDQEMTLRQMAECWGCDAETVRYWMVKLGVDRRKNSIGGGSGRSLQKKGPQFTVDRNGYEVFKANQDIDDKSTTFHHQLILIANGEDPKRVYSREFDSHHKNGIPWDNRNENLELITVSEHAKRHNRGEQLNAGGAPKEYTDEELLDWLNMFVAQFEFVPTATDLKGWPGPTPKTYMDRFGGWSEAVKKAGHEPRGGK